MEARSSDDLSAASRYPIGVIIPTYNRSEALMSCLRHLEAQTWQDFEVVVVDDGSTDRTPYLIEKYQKISPLHIRYIRQNNSGPARARNVAISALESPVCLMIGDDIFPEPEFVLRHLELHQRRPEAHVAGLGLTRWSESGQTVTSFMRWLEEGGVQFAYGDLFRGICPDWKYFYTSNLSLKTLLLRENPFNEAFLKAAAEDLELGYRLQVQDKLELIFIPDALAYHLHPTSFRQACNRKFDSGAGMRMLHSIWPDSIPQDNSSILGRGFRKIVLNNSWLLPPLTHIADIATTALGPNPLMRGVLGCYYFLGYKDSARTDQNVILTQL